MLYIPHLMALLETDYNRRKEISLNHMIALAQLRRPYSTKDPGETFVNRAHEIDRDKAYALYNANRDFVDGVHDIERDIAYITYEHLKNEALNRVKRSQ